MSVTHGSVMFCAPRINRFQKPPYERRGCDDVLLLCRRDERDGQVFNTWEFPRVGQFDYPGEELHPWSEGVFIASVEVPFIAPLIGPRDFFWSSIFFLMDMNPSVLHPDILPAIRRFDGHFQFVHPAALARVEARADSATSQPQETKSMSEFENMRRQLVALERRVGQPIAAESRGEYVKAQARANAVAQAYGDSAAPPLAGEQLRDYRIRLMAPYLKNSKFKDSNLAKVHDPNAFDFVEEQVYADAASEATHPTTGFRHGEVRAVVTMDPANRPITRYAGHPNAVWDQFNPPFRHVRRFMTPGTT